eukprot:GHVQ01012653.1.p1 GENE.GHVQ01012653.1~~GHVQ01012653.1.p1  ORF type:complete len:976 (-),score=144.85 GHVQ01012653.1:399-3326(-)
MTFQDVQDVLTKYGFRVLTFDLYGHGLSATPSYRMMYKTYGLDFFIMQTDELLTHLGLQEEPINLVGFSMGCCIAAGYARAHPDRVRRIVLISPAGMLQKKPVPVKCLQACPFCIYCIPCVVCRCCFNKKRFVQKFSDEERKSGMAEALWNRLMWQLFVKKGVIGAFLGCVSMLPLWNSRPIFQEVGCAEKPMLLLWGRQDVVCPPSTAKEVLTCFPNGHLIVFRDATHLLLADQPQAVIATLMTFLEFPSDCKLSEWKYILPFNSKGQYVPRYLRAPPNTTLRNYLKEISYRPRYHVRLPQRERSTVDRAQSSDPGEQSLDIPHSPGASSVAIISFGGVRQSQPRPQPPADQPSAPVGEGPYLTSPPGSRPPLPPNQLSPVAMEDDSDKAMTDAGAEGTDRFVQTPTGGHEGDNVAIQESTADERAERSQSSEGGEYYPPYSSGGNDNGADETDFVEPYQLECGRNLGSKPSLDSAGVVVAPDFLFHSQHPMASVAEAESPVHGMRDSTAPSQPVRIPSTANLQHSPRLQQCAAVPKVEEENVNGRCDEQQQGGTSVEGKCLQHQPMHMAALACSSTLPFDQLEASDGSEPLIAHLVKVTNIIEFGEFVADDVRMRQLGTGPTSADGTLSLADGSRRSDTALGRRVMAYDGAKEQSSAKIRNYRTSSSERLDDLAFDEQSPFEEGFFDFKLPESNFPACPFITEPELGTPAATLPVTSSSGSDTSSSCRSKDCCQEKFVCHIVQEQRAINNNGLSGTSSWDTPARVLFRPSRNILRRTTVPSLKLCSTTGRRRRRQYATSYGASDPLRCGNTQRLDEPTAGHKQKTHRRQTGMTCDPPRCNPDMIRPSGSLYSEGNQDLISTPLSSGAAPSLCAQPPPSSHPLCADDWVFAHSSGDVGRWRHGMCPLVNKTKIGLCHGHHAAEVTSAGVEQPELIQRLSMMTSNVDSGRRKSVAVRQSVSIDVLPRVEVKVDNN